MNERDCKGQMKGDIDWKQNILGVDRDQWEFYLIFFSWEIDIKRCQIYTKMIYIKFCIKNSGFKRIIFSKYTTNPKTTISQRSLRNLGLLLFKSVLREKTTICAIIRKSHFAQNCPIPLFFETQVLRNSAISYQNPKQIVQ